jgi:LacI family transcriptional regulator, gluconate utilization system Gnt-I transcriptional repressor
MSSKPTLKDIAKIAGVSEMTASRVLRGLGEASPRTRERVELAARDIGYVPNRIAGALSSKSVNLVAVVVPSISSFVFSEVLTGISDVLKQTPLQPVFGVTNYNLDTEEDVIREMLAWRPSGLIVTGLEHTQGARVLMENAGIPVAEVMDVDGTAVDIKVGISHHRAGLEMGQEILRRGYRHIGFIGTRMARDYRAKKRLAGFQQALEQHGVTICDQELYSGSSTLLLGRELTAMMLARTPDIDCIYYSSDMMSCGGLMHCIAHGVPVPGSLALAGFNGLNLRLGMPQIPATSNAYRFEIGQKAAQLVLDAHLSSNKRSGAAFTFEPKIEIGDTL